MDREKVLTELLKPFHPGAITWKPGALTKTRDKAMALAYADLRAYQSRLDEVCGLDWEVEYLPWGERIICRLTIGGITRSSTGEPDNSENAGTVAEAQAFKRTCAMFGLGRYLYEFDSPWVEFDSNSKSFTAQGLTKLNAIVASHYKRVMGSQPPEEIKALAASVGATVTVQDGDATFKALMATCDELGKSLYGEKWVDVKAHNIKRLTGEKPTTVNSQHIQTLINGLNKLKEQRQAA